MSRPNTELVEVFRAKTLNNNGSNYFSTEIPVSAPVTTAWLKLNHSVTIGTGTGAVSEGELLITKAMSLRSDKNEYFLKNVAGRGLYRYNQHDLHSAGQKDAVAASTGIYSVLYAIPFADFNKLRPYDTIFDNTRYRSVELSITQGGIADLLTTPGTATVVTTADLYFEQLRDVLPDQAKPFFVREIGNIQPVNPASQSFMDLERAQDLAYTAFMIGTDNSSTIGTPFSGTPADTTLNDLTLETNISYPFKSTLVDALKRINKFEVAESANPTGRFYVDLCKDGSNKSALYSNEFSKLRFTWNNGTLSTSQVSGMYDALRSLK